VVLSERRVVNIPNRGGLVQSRRDMACNTLLRIFRIMIVLDTMGSKGRNLLYKPYAETYISDVCGVSF
jgi:hypothetical protein